MSARASVPARRRRRRRRLHREPPRPQLCSRRDGRRARRRLRQLHLGAALAPRPVCRRPPARDRRGRGRGPRPAHRRDGRRDRRRPPRVQSRHRACDDRPDHRLRPGHAPHALRRRGGQPIVGSGSSSTRRVAASTATSATSEADEHHGPLEPVSTYGASKLAGEALIASYCHMFGLRGRAFRFGNVVGPNQTHGVGFDFVRKLLADPTRLEILGDGTQSKSYVHVDDVLAAVLLAGAGSAGALRGLQRRHRRLHHRRRDRRARDRVPRPRPALGRARLQRGRPRVEGRRARRAHRHRSHPGPRLGEPLQLARGAAGLDALDARRRPRRTALVTAT